MKKHNITEVIDGLPSSYNAEFVLRTKKICSVCEKKINLKNINESNIVFIEKIGFCHKNCLEKNSLKYKHLRTNDKNSPATMITEES